MMKLKNTESRTVFVNFGQQNTRRNFPRAIAGKRTESNFLRRFERAFLASESRVAIAAREFGLEGFGCADFVWLACESKTHLGDFTALAMKRRVRLTAIEGKISDWRKGLQQAFRYRYFAHRSLLVLPMEKARFASQFLPTFRRVRVGLWGFDESTGRLRKWFTPRPKAPLSGKAWLKAIHLFESNLDFSKLAKRG